MISKISSVRAAAFVGAVLGILSTTVGCQKNKEEAAPSSGVATTPPPPAYDQSGKPMQHPPPGMPVAPPATR